MMGLEVKENGVTGRKKLRIRKSCYICNWEYNTEYHHVFQFKNSNEAVWMCQNHHKRMKKLPHNRESLKFLKEEWNKFLRDRAYV